MDTFNINQSICNLRCHNGSLRAFFCFFIKSNGNTRFNSFCFCNKTSTQFQYVHIVFKHQTHHIGICTASTQESRSFKSTLASLHRKVFSIKHNTGIQGSCFCRSNFQPIIKVTNQLSQEFASGRRRRF